MNAVEMSGNPMFVRVNFSRFLENARQAGTPLTMEEAKCFLREWGFVPYLGNVWRCDDILVDYLMPNEIVTRIRV